MDQKLFKALTVIMPVLDDYQVDNIQDDTVGLFEDREFTAAYTMLKTEIEKERVRDAAPELLEALRLCYQTLQESAELYTAKTGNHLPVWTFDVDKRITSAIKKATNE